MKQKIYTTDGKVKHLASEEDINEKLSKIIGSKFDAYRKKWDLANNFDLVTDFPLFLQIELNQTCNYKCPHCIIGNPDEMSGMYNPKENLNFEQYKKIIDEAASYNCPSISVQGENEPFLDKNYENYLMYANKKGIIDIMTNTNGSAITKKRSQKILDTGITRLRFSLDAFTDETYKKVRVGAIDLDKVKRNIFILYGKIRLKIWLKNKQLFDKVLKAGEIFTIKPNQIHWFKAISKEGSIIEELSTESKKSDSYYLDKDIIRNQNRKSFIKLN